MSQGIRGANWIKDQRSEERNSALRTLAKIKAKEAELRKTHDIYYEKTNTNPPTWVRRVVLKK